MTTMLDTSEAVRADEARRVDLEMFRAWCEQAAAESRSTTARIIVDDFDDFDEIRFRLREETDRGPEDIRLLRERDVDMIRFERDGESRQFPLHRYTVVLTDRRLIIRGPEGEIDVCRAGPGTRTRRGPFPV